MRKFKYSKILTKKFLYQEYILNKKSCQQIAKELGCGISTIRRKLIKYNIKRRTISAAGLLFKKIGII